MANRENSKLGKCCFLETGERCACQRYRANAHDEYTCDVCYHDSGFHEEESGGAASSAPITSITPSPTVSTSSSLLNQVFSGRALEEQSIANELSQTFAHRNSTASHVRTRRNNQGSFRNFDPVSAATNYSLAQSSRNRRKRDEAAIKETVILVILLPDVGYSLQSPTASQDKYKKMYDAGYVKDLMIRETDDIVKKIEEAFPVLLEKIWTLRTTSVKGWTVEYSPPESTTITYSTIKRVLVNKNKLYISSKREPLPLPEPTISTMENQQQDHNLEINSSQLPVSVSSSTITSSSSTITPSSSTITSSSSTVITPSSSTVITPSSSTAITPSSSTVITPSSSTAITPFSPTNITNATSSITNISSSSINAASSASESIFYNNIDDFIQEIIVQMQLDYKVSGMTVIIINNTINVVKEMWDWIKNVNNIELLKQPVISVITERVIDAGGVFMHVTQQLWDQIKDYEDLQVLFITNNDTSIISSNPFFLHSKAFYHLGKMLFWCLMHDGAWPHWLNKFHFRYIFEMKINYIQVLEETQPLIFEIVKSIEQINEELKPGSVVGLNEWGIQYNLQEIDLIALAKNKKEDLINFICKHEVENVRKSHLNELRDGFNCFKLIEIIKNNVFNITWDNFEEKLHQIVISENDLLNQFDVAKNFKRVNTNYKREILYSKFLDFLKNLETPIERQNVLKFICGKITIPLSSNQKIQIQWKQEGSKEKPFLRFPTAKTCLKTIWLSENYDDDELNTFEEDLKYIIFGVNDGFND